MTPNPCYKCERRVPGCHGSCPDYAEYAEKNRRRSEAIYHEKVRVNACKTKRRKKKNQTGWRWNT